MMGEVNDDEQLIDLLVVRLVVTKPLQNKVLDYSCLHSQKK